MIQESTNIVNKERVKHLRNLLFVCKVQCSLIWNPVLMLVGDQKIFLLFSPRRKGRVDIPNALQVHGADLDNMANLFALQDAVSTATSHSSDIEQLGSINHVVIYSKSS